jgi:Domain of unknown function (DUF4062)
MDMAYFTARDLTPAQLCRDAVAGVDVLVVIAGFRYGSPVPDQPEVSYTELEHHTATQLGIPTLVFVLADDAQGPAVMFVDAEHAARQKAFRARLADSGVTTASITTPGDLQTKLLQALHELPRPQPTSPAAGEVRRLWTIPARTVEFTGRDRLLDDLAAALGSGEPVVGPCGDRDGWGGEDDHGDRVRAPPPPPVRHRLVDPRRRPHPGPRPARRPGPGPRAGRSHRPARDSGRPATDCAAAPRPVVARASVRVGARSPTCARPR